MGRKVSMSGTIVNYPLSFEGSEVENLIVQEVVSGERWNVDITSGAKEYTARFEAELVTGRPFYFALGSVNPALATVACTIYPYAELPEVTVTGSSESDSIQIKNAKCDRFRLNWTAGEFMTYEMEFTGTLSSQTAASGATAWNVIAVTCASFEVRIDGDTLTEVQSGNLEINNNLEPRYACGKGLQPRKIREQRLEITGALTVGEDDIGYFTTGGHSIRFRHTDMHGGKTLEIQCGSIWFDELPDEFTGHDVYEVEFSWTAQPISGGNIIVIKDSTTIKVW